MELDQISEFSPAIEEKIFLADDLLQEELASIPKQLAFRIGDVSHLLGVEPHVLRYWETEFPAFRPKKATNQQRVYTRREVEIAFLIRKLVHRDRFSIEGARKLLRQSQSQLGQLRQISSAREEHQELQKKLKRFEDSDKALLEVLHEIRRIKQFFS